MFRYLEIKRFANVTSAYELGFPVLEISRKVPTLGRALTYSQGLEPGVSYVTKGSVPQ